MRLVDLLLVLLFEGRRALGKSGGSSSGQLVPRMRRMDSAAEKSHRQLIDCIRSKDTDALIEAIENGGVEVIDIYITFGMCINSKLYVGKFYG